MRIIWQHWIEHLWATEHPANMIASEYRRYHREDVKTKSGPLFDILVRRYLCVDHRIIWTCLSFDCFTNCFCKQKLTPFFRFKEQLHEGEGPHFLLMLLKFYQPTCSDVIHDAFDEYDWCLFHQGSNWKHMVMRNDMTNMWRWVHYTSLAEANPWTICYT